MPTPKHTGNISCHFQQDTFLISKSWDFGAQPVSSEQNSKCKLGSLHNTHTTCERRQKQSDKCNVTSISQLTSTHSNLSGCKPISFPLSQPRYCYYPAGFLHESSHKNKQTKKWELSQKELRTFHETETQRITADIQLLEPTYAWRFKASCMQFYYPSLLPSVSFWGNSNINTKYF